MPEASRLAVGACLLLAAAGVAVAGVGLAAPPVAPDVMTMETMANHMGQERYQDRGSCDLWVVNMSFPADQIERTFPCSFYWDWSHRDDGTAYVQEALLDLEEDAIFEVPEMDRGRMEEWYHVDGHMLTDEALSFTLEADEEPGVLMPPPGTEDQAIMGWVTSGGERGGEESLLHPRELEAVEDTRREGLEVRYWQSSFARERVTWHGYDVYMTEEVDMWQDPRTAWVIEMRRHIVVEMTPKQMAEAVGQPTPPGPDGEPQQVMEFTYRSSPEAMAEHAETARTFRNLMFPIENGPVLGQVGVASAIAFGSLGLAGRTVRGLLGPPRGRAGG